MKTSLLVVLLFGFLGTAAYAENPRPANRKAATARKAVTGKPLPPTRINRSR